MDDQTESTPESSRDRDEESIASAFLTRVLADRENHDEKSLSDYVGLFPGHETTIVAEWHRLRHPYPTTVPDGGTSVTLDRAGDTAEHPAPFRDFGPFQLERELGRGGQAAVWRATDTRTGREVALKTFMPRSSLSTVAWRRFRREAESASRLDHQGLCRVFEADDVDGTPYIAMELIDGEPLSVVLERRRAVLEETTVEGAPTPTPDGSDVRTALRLVTACARALEAAHASGVVHRDVKPANIMVRPDESPVVIDFGFARLLDDTDGPTVTRSGDLFGTPPYMSPEQVARQSVKVDHRTDVWSLGVTLYECLTLRRPFEALVRERLYHAILLKPHSDPARLNAAVSRDLKTVLDVALEKDPDRRYGSAAAFADDLERVLEGRTVRARSPSPAIRVRRWALRNPRTATGLTAAFLGLAVGLFIAVTQWRRAEAAADAERLLSDVGILSMLEPWQDELWPADPQHADEMRQWLREARALSNRLPLHKHAASGDGSERIDRIQRRHREGVVRRITAIGGVIDDVERRLEFAETLEQRSLIDHAGAWRRAIKEVGDRSICPKYDGLVITPQIGLVPLDRNGDTGLWEFWALSAGPVPEDSGSPAARQGLVFVLVPGGTLQMGSPPTEKGRIADQEHLHPRELAPFFIGKYEVSQTLWMGVFGQDVNPSTARVGRRRRDPITGLHPVERVTWAEATIAARRLAAILPSEAQWEWSTRASTSSAFAHGERQDCLDGTENIADVSAANHPEIQLLPKTAGWDDGYGLHAPVGTFVPNPWGLFDVHGNVAEWCRDRWHPAAHEAASTTPDGLIPPHPTSTTRRAYRGGSFYDAPVHCRAARRWSANADSDRLPNLGLRLARSIDDAR